MASFFLEERVQDARLNLPEINNLHVGKETTPEAIINMGGGRTQLVALAGSGWFPISAFIRSRAVKRDINHP